MQVRKAKVKHSGYGIRRAVVTKGYKKRSASAEIANRNSVLVAGRKIARAHHSLLERLKDA